VGIQAQKKGYSRGGGQESLRVSVVEEMGCRPKTQKGTHSTYDASSYVEAEDTRLYPDLQELIWHFPLTQAAVRTLGASAQDSPRLSEVHPPQLSRSLNGSTHSKSSALSALNEASEKKTGQAISGRAHGEALWSDSVGFITISSLRRWWWWAAWLWVGR